MDDGDDKPANPLDECQEVVQNLKEENAQLRESAQTFGDLAERLNTKRRPRNHGLNGKSSKGESG